MRAPSRRATTPTRSRAISKFSTRLRATTWRARALPGEVFEARLPVIVAGTRRFFQVIDRAAPGGSAGIGIDITEVETMRAELQRMTDAHRRTLDQLATAVAIFSADQRLAFYNAGLPRAVRARPGVPRFRALRHRGAGPPARGAQDSRAGELPRLEKRAARSLSRARAAFARMASARRAHPARRHHAEPGRRRHLSVRRRDRAAEARAPLRGADRRAGRNARSARRGRRGVRQRRAARPAQSGLRAAMAPVRGGAQRRAGAAPAHRGRARLVPAAVFRRHVLGDSCAARSPGSSGASRSRRGSNGSTAACSIARPCRCPTAPRW